MIIKKIVIEYQNTKYQNFKKEFQYQSIWGPLLYDVAREFYCESQHFGNRVCLSVYSVNHIHCKEEGGSESGVVI